MIGKLFGIGNNENPVVRAIRLIVFAGVAAGAAKAIELLPNVDWPGEYDALIISVGTAVLGMADKWLRSRS